MSNATNTARYAATNGNAYAILLGRISKYNLPRISESTAVCHIDGSMTYRPQVGTELHISPHDGITFSRDQHTTDAEVSALRAVVKYAKSAGVPVRINVR